jgi:hypothetical protein
MSPRARGPAEPGDEVVVDIDDLTRGDGSGERAADVLETRDAGATGPQPICTVAFCPVCTAVAALGEVRPEVVEHLLLAGREFLLAVRAFIDARLEATEAPPDKPRMERISID